MDGLWSLVLEMGTKKTGAAIVINNGKLQGGDAGLVYQGTIDSSNGNFSAKLTATQFLAHPDAFFPGQKQFEVTLSGTSDGSTLSGTATLPIAPNQRVSVKGRKHADL